MSMFFTSPLALLLASAVLSLASEEMPSVPTAPVQEIPKSGFSPAPGVPQGLNLSRFSALSKKSPFTLASTTEENADFAKDLSLAGYFRMDGQDFVMVANRTRAERLMVGTQVSSGSQGMVLIKVERDPSGDPTKLKAQIRKGTETALLKYEAATAPAPGNPSAPAVPGQPVQAGQTPVPLPVSPLAGAAPGQSAPKPPLVLRRRIPPLPTPGPSR